MKEFTLDWVCCVCEQPEEVAQIKSVIGILYVSTCLNPKCEYNTVLNIWDSPTFDPGPSFRHIEDVEMQAYFEKKKSA